MAVRKKQFVRRKVEVAPQVTRGMRTGAENVGERPPIIRSRLKGRTRSKMKA